MRRTLLTILAVISASAVAIGQAPRTDAAHAIDGPLEIDLIATREGSDLFTKWVAGAPRITIRNVETVERGEFITIIVKFAGCAPNPQGLCNVVVDYAAFAPDGSLYGEMKGAELWIGKPPPATGASQLAADYLGLVIETQDQSGSYRLAASVTDRVSERKLTVTRAFVVPSD